MKTAQILLALAFVTALSFSCKKEDANPTNGTSGTVTNPEGVADITLTAGGQEFKLNGPAGWASAGGTKYIGANQNGNNLKTFAAYFNIDELPSVTTSYTLVADALDTDPNHITMHLVEITPGTPATLTEWNSDTTSGTLTLVVEGKKVTANLSGITLKAGQGTVGYTNGNTGAFSNDGNLTGTIVFYKE